MFQTTVRVLVSKVFMGSKEPTKTEEKYLSIKHKFCTSATIRDHVVILNSTWETLYLIIQIHINIYVKINMNGSRT